MPNRSYRLLVKIIAVLAAVMSWSAFAQVDDLRQPRRIVSLNLCADQYLLALADRGQIAGLTRNATDQAMSAGATQARGLHIMGQSAEEILAIDPDLIIGAPARRSGIMAALDSRNYRMVDLKPADSYEDIVAQTRAMAAAIGQRARGEALIAWMNRELAALPRSPGRPVAAYYQRRGYMTGTGTLVDDLMQRVGLINLAGILGKPSLSQLSLEEMIVAHPDFLIVENATDRITDQGTEMLHHPILDGIPRLRLPQAWTVCGGPAYVLAARSLSRQIAQARRLTRAKRINAR